MSDYAPYVKALQDAEREVARLRTYIDTLEPTPDRPMKRIGDTVTSTWSPGVTGTVVGYGTIHLDGEVWPVYLVDLGRNRMFDLDREPPGPAAARILSIRCDRVL